MNVQELINKLNAIEDKTMEVVDRESVIINDLLIMDEETVMLCYEL